MNASIWRSSSVPLTPQREAALEAAADPELIAHANTTADVSHDPDRLTPLPSWKAPSRIGRLRRVLGARIRMIDRDQHGTIVFVREDTLTDIDYRGHPSTTRIRLGSRWYDFEAAENRAFYITEDLKEEESAAGEEQQSPCRCTEERAAREQVEEERIKIVEFRARLREKHPRTLAYASWK